MMKKKSSPSHKKKAAKSKSKPAKKATKPKPKPKSKPRPKAMKAHARPHKAKPVHHHHEPEIPSIPKRIEDSLNVIKEEVAAPVQYQEVEMPKPTVVFDKVYLQSIKYEIAGIRQAMERVSRQLDRLEEELAQHVADE